MLHATARASGFGGYGTTNLVTTSMVGVVTFMIY